MFGMKTIVFTAGGAVLAGTVLLGWSEIANAFQTGARMAGDAVDDAVPVSFAIEQIETRIDGLDSTLARQRSKLVEQEVDCAYLEREVERARERVGRLEGEVVAARRTLGVHRASYTIGNRTYDRERVVDEAKAKAERLTRARNVLAAKRATLETLRGALQQADAQIEAASRERETYAMRLAALRAKAENVAIRRELVTSLGDLPDGIDDGAFQDVERAFAKVERELTVQDRLLAERTDAVPSREAISFEAGEPVDILEVLNSALGDRAAESGDDGLPPIPDVAAVLP